MRHETDAPAQNLGVESEEQLRRTVVTAAAGFSVSALPHDHIPVA